MKKIIIPPDVTQHITAGPYSPVIEIKGGSLVVLSGQAAIDMDGNVIGDTIEEQTKFALENCGRLLRNAGCTFADVFKVNAYLADLQNWHRFNAVYTEVVGWPYPARTAIQTGLLDKLLVELEMWAVKE